ncbi:MAG: MarR family transcriptional regulator [Candidatus Eisenbacteria bacterium]|uniref:MarR family transcriptional regulator n=1 Tax=Eiseniibacteriota bacterium TaxID=2212470 RepID=A0A948WD40_UNCEI|nr:MarR family transcriptional regulator [Candidatus Eisenbacteria bacterium]MBU2691493.1 MarR family transcriptional regulator [Candidatus Eisenbacteria bacterium]
MPLQFLAPLHKAGRKITRHLENHLKRSGLSSGEAHILIYLRECGPCTVGVLQIISGCKRSTLTSTLDRLSSKSFVVRKAHPGDRRAVLVHITSRGRTQAAQISRHMEALETAIRNRVRVKEIEGFNQVLAAITAVTQIDN